jgi:hypothetical protein
MIPHLYGYCVSGLDDIEIVAGKTARSQPGFLVAEQSRRVTATVKAVRHDKSINRAGPLLVRHSSVLIGDQARLYLSLFFGCQLLAGVVD